MISDSQNGELIEEWNWESARPSGRAVLRSLAHKEGIAHEGVHLWIVRKNPAGMEILFQHRAPEKELFPSVYDITVGGHVPFGQNENKIQKESSEEIGIRPDDNELIDLGFFRYEEKTEGLFHREFQHVYLLQNDSPLTVYHFADDEVDAMAAIKLTDVKKLFLGEHTFDAEVFFR